RLLAAHFGMPAAPVNPKWLAWTIKGGYAIPGLLVGGLIGWSLIRPVNAGLGWFFRNFNRAFDKVTAAYGWTVGKSLRRTFVVLDPFDKRQAPGLRDVDIIAKMKQGWAKEVRGDAVVTANGAAPVPGLGVAGGFKFVVQDRGDNGLEALQTQTEILVGKLRQ